ncbi:MAG: hypothetical protein A2Y92_01285 [Chloroflexi bacterium RBG_13_57_8]|nr:MAG: hypothetical protein A2Y92_01285 [Chloroflexi bacterium RBG_13_57_8]
MAAKKKYQKYVFSGFREEMKLPFIASPQAYFRGAHQIPGAGVNMGWQLFIKPVLLEKEPHTHNADEYLIFLGCDPADWFSSFDAEIDFYLGDEKEQYLITKPTIVYIPPNMTHCPLNFRVLKKPVLFTALLQTPVFTKTMNGKEISFKGPGPKGSLKAEMFE